MKISDLIKMGLRNLARRKARTALTIIGVVIGTISIMVMVSIGLGVNQSYQSSVMELGSLTTITVSRYADIYDDEGNWTDWKEQTLNDDLVNQIREIEHVRAVSPIISMGTQLKSGKFEAWVQLYAMDSGTFEDFDFPPLVEGEYPTPENNHIIIFGSESLKNFYNPYSRYGEQAEIQIGKDKITFQFNPWEFQMNEKKKPFTLPITNNYALLDYTNNWEYDYNIYMDKTYFTQIYMKYCNTLTLESRKNALKKLTEYETIKINVDNIKNVSDVQDQIKKMGFQTSSLQMYLEPMQETADMLQMVLGSVGAVAMLVSAISIANTMVMSIYERTKEIGIMKVLGCIVKDIKKLFLFEAAMIGLIGGIIGVGLSYIGSWAINKYGSPLFESILGGNYMLNMETAKFSVIPFWLPFLAAGFAMLVGILSGYYPARRATKISAIEAMKTEG